ncbi:MAG: hypothetical protein MUE57_09325 [Syntrophales bacterium]|nr:hypothetical protein [Syntrophales bacterium]
MTSPRKGKRSTADRPGRKARCGWMVFLLVLLAGCVHVPVSSDIVVADRLEAATPLEPGDVLLVCGENAAPPEQNAAVTYFTAGCRGAFHKNTVGGLARLILKANPQPGRFAVRVVKGPQEEAGAGRPATEVETMPAFRDFPQDAAHAERLRYAVQVKERFETAVHMPLYVSPFGVASCSNKTVLEARVWDLPGRTSLGSFTVTAEGEYSVAAYVFHVIVFPDTQRDAAERLAREIVARLAGLKPLDLAEE